MPKGKPKHPSEKTAKENGVEPYVFAEKVFAGQSIDLPVTMRLKRIEDAMKAQGYTMAEVSETVTALYNAR